MHAAIRPLVTTGVAMVGAAVIVANPISLPTPNVAIRADQSAADPDRGLYLLDPIFLASIAALDSQPTDAMESVEHLLAALTDGGPPVSREAIETAYAAGVAVVSGPTQGAASVLNLPAEVGSSNNPLANPTLDFQQTLAQLVADANDVGAQVVASAFAAGAVAAAMPSLIISTVTSAGTGDLTAALYSAVSAVIAPIGPPAMVVDAVRTVIESEVAEVTGTAPPAAAPEVAVHKEPVARSLASVGESASGTAESRQAAAGTTEAEDQTAPEGAGTIGATASADDTTANGASDLTDGNKVEPGTKAPNPSDAEGDSLESFGEQVKTSLERIREELLLRLAGQRGSPASTGTAGSPGGTGDAGGPSGAGGGSGSGGSGGTGG